MMSYLESSQPLCRIAFVVNQLADTGPIFVIREIIEHLPKETYKIYLIELCRGSEDMREKYKPYVDEIEVLGFSKMMLEFATRRVAKRLHAFLEKENISIVHSHTYHPDLVVAALPSSSRYYRVTTQHNLSKDDFTMKKGLCMGWYMHLRLRRALRKISHIVGISRTVTQYYASHTPKRAFHYTIYNGVDTSRFVPATREEKIQLRKQLHWPEEARVMVMVGSLSPRKSPLLVIRALGYLASRGQLPASFRLCFVGDGPLMRKCQKKVKRSAQLSSIVWFAGFTQEVDLYLRASDCAITASLSEGFGLNVLEAIVSDLPILTTHIPVFDELIAYIPSLQKLQFIPKNPQNCALALQNSFNFVLSKQEHQLMREMFSAEEVGRNYHKLYSKLLRNS